METIIVGAGNFAQIAKLYFEEYSQVKISRFAVDTEFIDSTNTLGIDIMSVEELLELNPSNYQIFIAIGYSKMNQRRTDVFEKFVSKGFKLISFVHPSIKQWTSSSIGQNCFIFEDNTIQPFTKILNNSILWSGNHIGHHTVVRENCFISSHVVISGSCEIGSNSFIGVNATIHDGIKVGPRSLIGAGAIISRDTPPDSIYVPKPTLQNSKQSYEINF